MRRQHGLVFEDLIAPKTAADTDFYTSLALNNVLATSNQLAVQLLIDNCKCSTASTITVTLETSGDSKVWVMKSGATPIAQANLEINSRSVSAIGWDTGVLPNLAFVRLRISWSGFTLPASAYVRVYVTSRDPALVRDPMLSEGRALLDGVAKNRPKVDPKSGWQDVHSDASGHTTMGKDPSPGHHGNSKTDP